MKVLIVYLHGIGDSILFTPALRFYREKHPDYELYILCLKLTEGLWKTNPIIKKVFASSYFNKPPHHGWYHLYILERIKIQKEINKIRTENNIDKVVYIVPRSIKLFKFLLPLPGKIRRLPFFHKFEEHEIIKLCRLLNVDKNKLWPKDFKQEIYITDKYRKKASDILKKIKKPICVMHTSGSSKNKDLTAYEANKIIDYLKEKGFNIIILNGNLKNSKIHLINSNSILLSAALIEKSDLFIGIDSGPAHIAEALNKSSVVIAKAFRTELLYMKKNNNMLLNNYDYGKIREAIDQFSKNL